MTELQQLTNRTLQINVGFLLKEGAGVSRVLSFAEHNLTIDDLELSVLRGDLTLTRTVQGILVRGQLMAEMVGECARCLTAVTVPIGVEQSIHFVYPPAAADEDDNTVDEDGNIQLAPFIREDAILAIPIYTLCRADCQGLCTQCGQNLNEATCECDHNTIDPRLAGLSVLLD